MAKTKETKKKEPIVRVPVKSSMIAEVGHDGVNTLEVKFLKGGKVFQYTPVSKVLYDELLVAPSQGQFFYSKIRDNNTISYSQIPQ